MENIKITINDKIYEYKKGTTLSKISENFKENFKFPILLGYLDNEMVDLNKKINKDCTIKFIDLTDPIGNRIYQKGLILVLDYAYKKLFGEKAKLKACHSIDKAIKMKSDIALSEEQINQLKKEVEEVVQQDLPITKCLVKRIEAKNYFLSLEDTNKANTFKYITSHYVTLYKIENTYHYMFANMPISTGVFQDFDLKFIDENKFLLEFPNIEGVIPEYTNREKIIEAFNQNYKLAKRLGVYTSSDLNKAVSTGKISDIIKLAEVISGNDLLNIAKEIDNHKDRIKIILIAGPSSSGKTTTAHKLSMFLKSFGLNPKPLSIDDYFVNRKDTPRLPNGDYDFESLQAVDITLFNDHLKRLLNKEKVETPTFNFKKGEKEYLGNTLKLEEDDILIIEGLHAINEELTKDIERDKKYKIYISPLTDLNIDNLNMLSTSDVRLLRRIIRDNRTRGYTAEHTIKSWQNVRNGEEKNIFPFQNDVDSVFNSSFIYELGVLKIYASPLLYAIDQSSPCYEEVIRLINLLSMFLPIPPDEIPSDSILREFIGNSYFE